MREAVGFRGMVYLRVFRGEHTIRGLCQKNRIVESGKELLSKLVVGNGQPVTHLGIGTGTDVVQNNDTTLGSEQFRQAILSTQRQGRTVEHTAKFIGNWSAMVTEAGLFNASGLDNGEMLSRALLDNPVTKNAGEGLEIVWILEAVDI